MAEQAPPPVLRRQLVAPIPSGLAATLLPDLMRAVGTHMPLTSQYVRFVNPAALALDTVSHPTFVRTRRAAQPKSPLTTLPADQVETRLWSALQPSALTSVTIPADYNQMAGSENRLRLNTYLQPEPPSYIDESIAALTALHRLANLQPPKPGTVVAAQIPWLRFYSTCPYALRDELVEIVDRYIPPDTEFTFERVLPVEVNDRPELYLPLDHLFTDEAPGAPGATAP
jgi:hypothetical protein